MDEKDDRNVEEGTKEKDIYQSPTQPQEFAKDSLRPGSVGCVAGGRLKVGTAIFVCSDKPDPEEKYKELQKTYGKHISFKWISVENPEKILKKLKDACAEFHDIGDIYDMSAGTAIDTLKDVADVKKCNIKKEKMCF